ncbi:MAG TPA: hypothetical protein VMM56_03700 [Planctomycetaceae bacterium]|nr:hypothetical protein [Planctomycetaceae bacterium]
MESIKEFALMRNKMLAIVGAILIVAGAVALFYRGIPYTSRDVVLDVGPLTATAESEKTWPVPPILGGLAIAGGVALVVVGTRKA